MIVGYYKNYLYTTDISSAYKKKKKKKIRESQYMVSHPENGSDSPIGSDRDRGRDSVALLRCDVGLRLGVPEAVQTSLLAMPRR